MPGDAAGILLVAENPGSGSEAVDEVLARARSGDRDAFNILIMRHEQRILRLAQRMLGSREDAMDAAQETFLRVFRHLHTFDLKRDFSAWLYRIAVNVCRDSARRRKPDSPHALVEEAPVSERQESDAILAQQRRILRQALSILSSKERAALVLRDIEGLDTVEVERLLNSTPTTVRSQISSARSKLREFHLTHASGAGANKDAGKG